MSEHTPESDAPTYSQEDLARAWDEGYGNGACAVWNGETANPYRVTPPDKG